jgi:hypothetical protein
LYKSLRNTHLLLGLFCLFFLGMYGLSAVQMSHNNWFHLKPEVTTQRLRLPSGLEPRAVGELLMNSHGMRGELAQIQQSAPKSSFRIVRPGTVYEISYNASIGDTEARINTADWIGMLNRIHHIGGLWHDYRLLNLWGAIVAIVSAALLALGITGIYLWFKIHRERLIGLILLAVSLGYSVTLLVLIRTA